MTPRVLDAATVARDLDRLLDVDTAQLSDHERNSVWCRRFARKKRIAQLRQRDVFWRRWMVVQ